MLVNNLSYVGCLQVNVYVFWLHIQPLHTQHCGSMIMHSNGYTVTSAKVKTMSYYQLTSKLSVASKHMIYIITHPHTNSPPPPPPPTYSSYQLPDLQLISTPRLTVHINSPTYSSYQLPDLQFISTYTVLMILLSRMPSAMSSAVSTVL